MHTPNILITNYCNQKCPFCFASKEMEGKQAKKEMSVTDFKTVLRKLKKEKAVKTIKLLGGEPTLHTHFKEFINLAVKDFSHIQIFTNGVFSDEIAEFLEVHAPHIALTVNIMTPGFLLNPKIRAFVSQRIRVLSQKIRITLSLTFDMHTDMDAVFQALGPESLKLVHRFRLGFSNPVAGGRNFYEFSDFPLMGTQLVSVATRIRENNTKAGIILNCGLTRCMFTQTQFEILQESVELAGFGCFGKKSFDLQTDLTAFGCFPLSNIEKSTTRRRTFNRMQNEFLEKRFESWNKTRFEKCSTCPFYGIGKDKCPGPCLAFLSNSRVLI